MASLYPDPLKQLHPDPKNCIEGNHPKGVLMFILTDDAPGVLDLPGAELTGEHPGQNLAAPIVLPVLGPAQQVRLRGCDVTKWLARMSGSRVLLKACHSTRNYFMSCSEQDNGEVFHILGHLSEVSQKYNN